jgi:Zn-dependent protease with chaperone function
MMMLINDWAVAMNLVAIALLGFVISVLLLSGVWLLLSRFVHLFSVNSQKLVMWIWVTGPWILGFVTMLVFSPALEQTPLHAWISEVVHWHHLYVFQLDSWHSLSVALFITFSAVILTIKWRQLDGQISSVHMLKAFSKLHQRTISEQRVIVIDSDVPTAFTSGLIKPICYVSSGLVKQLTDKELHIVIEHELAHVRKKDPLFKLLFAFFSAYYPRQLAQKLNAKYSLITEHLADQATVMKHSAEDIASTLVKVVRIQKAIPVYANSPASCFFGADNIAQRVQRLLKPINRPIPMAIPIGSMLILLCMTVLAVDATHHLIEFSFSHP